MSNAFEGVNLWKGQKRRVSIAQKACSRRGHVEVKEVDEMVAVVKRSGPVPSFENLVPLIINIST
jgi:hypothetical protein